MYVRSWHFFDVRYDEVIERRLLTCCKEQCQVTICVPMAREGCRHRRSPPGSTSACNRSTPGSTKKKKIDLTRMTS